MIKIRSSLMWLLRAASITILVLGSYTTWVVVSTPNALAIKSCLITKYYKVSLCEKNKNYVYVSRVGGYLKNLILIAEDAGFYYHNGFDWKELKKSFESNLSLRRIARGGSTITQQLAKNVFLPFDKTFTRKFREAIITRDLEQLLTKHQILEKYLNVIEFGPHIYGVGQASMHYFNKTADQLNLLESAFLTYLIPNPKDHYRTFKNKKLTPYARKRILDLCYRMFRFHRISQDQYFAVKDSIDDFPWTTLSEVQIARLSGVVLDNSLNTSLDATSDNNILPNFDSADKLPDLNADEIMSDEVLEETESLSGDEDNHEDDNHDAD